MQKLDLIGQRFGRLTVIKAAESTPRGKSRWVCRCDCGKECTVLGLNLRRGHTASCGCLRENDLAGQRFGKLTVLCRSDIRTSRGARTTPAWECRCDCGAVVYQPTDVLTNGDPHMCTRCRELYATEKARENAGYVGGTQLSRIRDMSPSAANTSGVRGVQYCKTSNNKAVNCVAYFASMEHANAFEDNFKNNNSSYSSITIGEIVNLAPVNPT